MNYDLVGIGNALVDIEVQVDDSFVEEISKIACGEMVQFTIGIFITNGW